MNYLVLNLAAVLITFTSVSANAGGYFSLEKKGTQVCLTESGKELRCLATLESMGLKKDGRIEIVEKLKIRARHSAGERPELTLDQFVEVGGALMISPEDAKGLVQNYRRLSVHSLALGDVFEASDDGVLSAPFFASVYWQGALGMEGTLHVEGVIQVVSSEAMENKTELEDIQKWIQETVRVDRFSDSGTEWKLSSLSVLEKVARKIHFTKIGTNGKSVDEATVDLLQRIVAPVIIGEVVIVPTVKGIIELMDEAIGDALRGKSNPAPGNKKDIGIRHL